MKEGFGLIEVLVATAIIGVTFFALVGTARLASVAVEDSVLNTRASFLLEEGIEVSKLLRDTGWNEHFNKRFTVGQTYYPVFTAGSNTWTLTASNPGLIDGLFTRTMTFTGVCRATGTDDIVGPEPCAGGNYSDPDARLVRATVSWARRGGMVRTQEAETYLINIFQN